MLLASIKNTAWFLTMRYHHVDYNTFVCGRRSGGVFGLCDFRHIHEAFIQPITVTTIG